MQSAVYQDAHPWSAVFVSYVMRTAGAGPAFAYSAAHQTYIRAARQNRLQRQHREPVLGVPGDRGRAAARATWCARRG